MVLMANLQRFRRFSNVLFKFLPSKHRAAGQSRVFLLANNVLRYCDTDKSPRRLALMQCQQSQRKSICITGDSLGQSE